MVTAMVGVGLAAGSIPIVVVGGLIGVGLLVAAVRGRPAYRQERWEAAVTLAVMEAERHGPPVDARLIAALRDAGPGRDLDDVLDEVASRGWKDGRRRSGAGEGARRHGRASVGDV